jgi:sporulation protein YlmC with PRC-barrel domain
VRTSIDLVNTSGGSVGLVRLNTIAAKLGNMKDLKVKVDGAKVSARRSGQTILVPFRTALAPGQGTTVSVAYKARLTTTTSGRRYLFAKLGGVAQIYRFIPWLSRKIAFGSGNHGEPFLTPVSPRVDVEVSADRKLVWATTGRRIGKVDARTFRFVATDVRDFNIAASPGYRTQKRSYKGRTTVVAYTRSGNGKRMVALARKELARYEAKTGVKYPHATYAIAETGGGLAMESPALIWIPRSRPASDHPYLISHETAHQWWYSTVGNDQSTSAFADEAMADYFSRKAHLSIRSSRCKTDRLDREIRAYSDYCYFEVVYVQGARFLENLRKDFGDARFKAAIRRYAKDNRFKISSNVRLLEAFRAEMGDRVLKRYRKRFPSLY